MKKTVRISHRVAYAGRNPRPLISGSNATMKQIVAYATSERKHLAHILAFSSKGSANGRASENSVQEWHADIGILTNCLLFECVLQPTITYRIFLLVFQQEFVVFTLCPKLFSERLVFF